MRRALALTLGLGAALSAACFGPGPTLRDGDDAGPTGTDLTDKDGGARFDVDLGESFSLVGLVPSHGPFSGGTRTVMNGRGFSSRLSVWVGGIEVPKSAIFASDPTRAALTTPAHAAGPVDVRIRDEGTADERVLKGGFIYDALDVVPNSGATTGGTRIAVHGSGTAFVTGSLVGVDGKDCTDVLVTSPTELECTTPANAPGSKDVIVTLPDTSQIIARDAYSYSDSEDGYRGGLSGGILNGKLKVIVLDGYAGLPVPGAKVIAGTDSSALAALTDATGVATLTDAKLTGLWTVTAGEKCHQPTSFVDVPVDTVTLYLNPMMDLACASGDPPSGVGKPKDYGAVSGELVWPSGIEFQVAGNWSGVPDPVRSTERRAAYVFAASGSATDTFYLPDPKSATTMEMAGAHGYTYSYAGYPGNTTLYALAGIEDSAVNPPRFTAYVMGAARGVPVQPKTTTTGVDIPMDVLLDHQVTLVATPPSGSPGPDRLLGQLAVSLGPNLYATLPSGQRTVFLPNPAPIPFVGVPALAGTLTAESYVLSAAAVTGKSLSTPASILAHVLANDANVPVSLTGFLPVPKPVQPGVTTWNGHTVQLTAGGSIDLIEMLVTSGGGLVTWMIVSPGKTSFELPDLALFGTKLGLIHGPIRTTAYVAQLADFHYEKLRYGQLGSGAWPAYAVDGASGAY